jgi:hypothetical protein
MQEQREEDGLDQVDAGPKHYALMRRDHNEPDERGDGPD